MCIIICRTFTVVQLGFMYYVSRAIAIDLCGLPKIDFCCNYFEVLHLYKLPASAYFYRYKVRGGAFDLAGEVTQCPFTHQFLIMYASHTNI